MWCQWQRLRQHHALLPRYCGFRIGLGPQWKWWSVHPWWVGICPGYTCCVDNSKNNTGGLPRVYWEKVKGWNKVENCKTWFQRERLAGPPLIIVLALFWSQSIEEDGIFLNRNHKVGWFDYIRTDPIVYVENSWWCGGSIRANSGEMVYHLSNTVGLVDQFGPGP